MSKKIVVKLDLHDNKDKQKAMKAVAGLIGIDALSVDMAARKMTVIGMVDPVDVVSRLRKTWAASIDSVGPVKEPEKKDGEKKDAGADGKKDGDKKPATLTEQQLMELMFINQQRAAYAQHMNPDYFVQSMEENPNSCAIC